VAASCKNSLVYFLKIFRYIYLVHKIWVGLTRVGHDPFVTLAVTVSVSYASESRKAQPARNRFREVEEEHVH
jgi:hypothetical protein